MRGSGVRQGAPESAAATLEAPEQVSRIRLFLQDHRVLDADVRVPRGQPLHSYLAGHTRYLNLTGVEWLGTRQRIAHLALRVDKVLWALDPGEGWAAVTGAGAAPDARRVEVELDGGYLLAGGLLVAPGQRLSDYLHAAPTFLPLLAAELRPRGRQLGEIALNHDFVQLVREAA